MSLTINRIGGSGGVSESNAILMAHVPTGSTVTASKGGVTLTPKMWVSGSTADEDVAMFIFSPGQFDSVNPWTVTAIDGNKRVDSTITIGANSIYELILTYNLYLFKNGNISSDYEISLTGNANTNINADNNLVCNLTSNSYGGVWFSPVIDLNEYERVDIIIASSSHSYALPIGFRKEIGTPTSENQNIMAKSVSVPTGAINEASIYTIDLTEYQLTDTYYFGLTLAGTNGLSSIGYARIIIRSITFYRA